MTTQKYTFTVTPSSDGQLTVTIPADSVKDPAGNSNTVSNVLRVTFDRTTHVPALSTDAASPTNAASVTVAVDFGEPIDDATFTLDDISVTGGDASGLAQEGVTTQKYTFTVTPSSDGQLTVTIPTDSVKLPVTFDRTPAGNSNTISNVLRDATFTWMTSRHRRGRLWPGPGGRDDPKIHIHRHPDGQLTVTIPADSVKDPAGQQHRLRPCCA